MERSLMICKVFKNLHTYAQFQNVTTHQQAPLDLYRLVIRPSTWCYHIQNNYHGVIKCHDTIESTGHKLSDETEIPLSSLANHFPPTILVSLSGWSLSVRDSTPFMDTVAHHDARIPHLFLSEGPSNPHAMQCNSSLPFCWRKGRMASMRARRVNPVVPRHTAPYC